MISDENNNIFRARTNKLPAQEDGSVEYADCISLRVTIPQRMSKM